MEICDVVEAKDAHERTCVGCREKAEPAELVRLATSSESPFVAPNLGGKSGGRGVSVHPRRACIVLAARGGLSRSLKREVRVDAEALTQTIARAYAQRTEGLLLAAGRTRAVALGTDATREAMQFGKLRGLVVATDAHGKREDLVAAAARLGCQAVVFSTKASLGRLFGRDELGVIGILEDRIAKEVVESGQRVFALSEAE